MLSFNALILNLLPTLTSSMSTLITFALDVAAIGFLAWMWRGQWIDDPEVITHRLLATLVVTLLISNHDYLHGAVLLVIPCLAIRNYRPWTASMSTILVGSLILPPILFLMSSANLWDWWIPLSMILLVFMLAGVAVSYFEGRLAIQRGIPLWPQRTQKAEASLLNR
jgi:hypothetical protein